MEMQLCVLAGARLGNHARHLVPRHQLATGRLRARGPDRGGAYQAVHGSQDGRLHLGPDKPMSETSDGEFGREGLLGSPLNILAVLFQVQHSIQLEAVNKIKVDPRWGFETHGFSDKASTTRREWGRFPGSSCAPNANFLSVNWASYLSFPAEGKGRFFLDQSLSLEVAAQSPASRHGGNLTELAHAGIHFCTVAFSFCPVKILLPTFFF